MTVHGLREVREGLRAPLGWSLAACWLVYAGFGSALALAEEPARSSHPVACTEFRADDLTRLGRLKGAWLGPHRFVLADPKRQRMLAYEVSDFGVESIRAPVGESWLSAARAVQAQPIFAARSGDGLLVSVHSPPGPDSPGEARLVQLTDEFTPVHAIQWPSEQLASGQSERQVYAAYVGEVLVSGDRLAIRARRGGAKVFIELTLVGNDGVGGLREDAVWPTLDGEYPFVSHLPVQSLAATEGTDRGMYALRFAKVPFIQVLGHKTMKRLSTFPESATPLPSLPVVDGWGAAPAFYAAAESAAFPVGLYGQEDRLYVLTREFVGGLVLWDLHQLDPVEDQIVGRTRLPTNAAHVSLLPGEKYWVLEESSSFEDDMFRQPTRLLLLDSEAVRAGDELRCD